MPIDVTGNNNVKIVFRRITSPKVDRFTSNQHQNEQQPILYTFVRIHYQENALFCDICVSVCHISVARWLNG